MALRITQITPEESRLVIAFNVVGEGGREFDDKGFVHYYGSLPVDKEMAFTAIVALLEQVHEQIYADSYAAFALKKQLEQVFNPDGTAQ